MIKNQGIFDRLEKHIQSIESAPNTSYPTCDFETPLKGFVL